MGKAFKGVDSESWSKIKNRKLEQKSLEENVPHSIRRSPTGPIDRPLIKEIGCSGQESLRI